MMAHLMAVLISLFAGWTVAASEALFRAENRPGIFAGTPGTILLLVITGVGALFAAGGILWILRAISSSTVMVIIAGGGWLGFYASNWLNVNTAGAVNRLIVGVTGLMLLYAITQTWLPPFP